MKQGIAEVREGKVFCLSLPLDYPGGNLLNPRRHPPILRPTLRNGRPTNMVYVVQRDNPQATDVINDDAVILHLQYSTQWGTAWRTSASCSTPMATASPNRCFYNGYRAGKENLRSHRP